MTAAPKRPKTPPPAGGPDARRRAMGLIAEGVRIVEVARMLNVRRQTVRAWRESPEGQRELAAARAKNAAFFEQAAERARASIREAVGPAVDVLREKLHSRIPFEAVAAAKELLNRGGVPATTVLDAPGGNGTNDLDPSNLTDEEIVTLMRLQEKLRRGGNGPAGSAAGGQTP